MVIARRRAVTLHAACDPSVAVGDLVILAASASGPTATRASAKDPARLPAMGCVVAKLVPDRCTVRVRPVDGTPVTVLTAAEGYGWPAEVRLPAC